MKACVCGNQEFFATQRVYETCKVTEENDWIETLSTDEADKPYGPYVCTKCNREYDELSDLPETDEEDE